MGFHWKRVCLCVSHEHASLVHGTTATSSSPRHASGDTQDHNLTPPLVLGLLARSTSGGSYVGCSSPQQSLSTLFRPLPAVIQNPADALAGAALGPGSGLVSPGPLPLGVTSFPALGAPLRSHRSPNRWGPHRLQRQLTEQRPVSLSLCRHSKPRDFSAPSTHSSATAFPRPLSFYFCP